MSEVPPPPPPTSRHRNREKYYRAGGEHGELGRILVRIDGRVADLSRPEARLSFKHPTTGRDLTEVKDRLPHGWFEVDLKTP